MRSDDRDRPPTAAADLPADLVLQRAQVSSGAVLDIEVRAGRVSAHHGPLEKRVTARRILPVDGRLVLPGLINAHTHLDKASLSSRVNNLSGTVDEARSRMREAKSTFTVADIESRAGAVLQRFVANGVTAVRSHVDVDPIVGLKGIEALLSLRRSFSNVIDLQLVAFPQEGMHQHPGTVELMAEALRMGVDVVGGHLSIAHDVDGIRRDVETVFALATRFDRDIDVHVDHSIDRDYSKLTRRRDGHSYPDDLGVVHLAEATIREGYQGRVTASHLCGLDSVAPNDRADVIDLILRANVA